MVETLKIVLSTLLLLFQSRSRLQVEILALRQQFIVLRRTAPKRVRLRALDRLLFVRLYRLWPGILDSIAVIQPDTIVRWHRRGFRALWRWKSLPRMRARTTPLITKKTQIRTPFRSPRANAIAERWVRSARTECLHLVLIFSERHLRHVLAEYVGYFNCWRPHRSIGQRAPRVPPITAQRDIGSNIIATPVVGGLHRIYNLAA
jgi:hypothetical protein